MAEAETISEAEPDEAISVEEADENLAAEQKAEADEDEETFIPGDPPRKWTGRREGKFTENKQDVTCPECGRPAEADLAVNPGTEGGPGAPPELRPKGLKRPITPVLSPGPWYLIVCEAGHRTLWHASRLGQVGGEAPGEGGGKGKGMGKGKAKEGHMAKDKDEDKDKDKDKDKGKPAQPQPAQPHPQPAQPHQPGTTPGQPPKR